MMKYFALYATLVLLSAGQITAVELPPVAKWAAVGDGTKLETVDNVWRITPGSGKENSMWTRPVLPLEEGKYRISFRYRLADGQLHFIVKHGNDSYALLEKRLPATGGEWRDFAEEVEETVPGGHGSVWFHVYAPTDVADLKVEALANEAAQTMDARLKAVPVKQQTPAVPDMAALPDLRKTFLIAQEWHSWFHADTAEQGGDPFFKTWGYADGRSEYSTAAGPLWRRAGADLIYPYLGFYGAGNVEVIRWQLACMKNSGLNGVTIQMYPDQKTGRFFNNLEFFELCLKEAQAAKFAVGIHDEIQFMPEPAKSVEAFIERASSIIALAKKYPDAFLRRNGGIVYQYEAFALPYTVAEHQEIMTQVEAKTGQKIYWMVCGPAEKMIQIEALDCLKYPANTWSHTRKEGTFVFGVGGGQWTADSDAPDEKVYWQKWEESLQKSAALVAEANQKRQNKLEQAIWIYPGFNNAGRWAKTPDVLPERSFDRSDYFVRTVNTAMKVVDPAVINLSSWNDREEKSTLEPSWGNESPDPFAMVRLIAAMKRQTFAEPPLPPKEFVDPWLWSTLYRIDRTPPRIIGARYHVSEANLAVDAIDDFSGPVRVEVSASPLAYVNLAPSKPLTYHCTFFGPRPSPEAKAVELKKDAPVKLTLSLPAMPDGCGPVYLGIKYRAPGDGKIVCSLNYPRQIEGGNFRLLNTPVSTIAPGPVLPGKDGSRWRAVLLHNFKMTPETAGSIDITLKYQGPDDTAATVEQLVLYPAAIVNESSVGFALPGPGKEVKTFVVGFPDKLLPRNFTGVPFALQAVDAEGNRSSLQLFDLTDRDMTTSLGGRSIDIDGYFYQ